MGGEDVQNWGEDRAPPSEEISLERETATLQTGTGVKGNFF